MDRPGDSGADAELARGARREALVAAAELRRRKQESCRRLDRLEEERRVIEEIRDTLASEEKALAGRLGSAREERDRVADKTDHLTRRGIEMGGKIDELEREIAILERRRSESAAREQELACEIVSAEKDLLTARSEISHASGELETGREALARMDRKLSLGRSNR